MLARRVGLLTNSRNTFLTARPFLNTPWQCRNYALSRFDERRPGGGRERPKLAPRDAQNRRSRGEAEESNDRPYEQQFPGEQSPLWEASQRPPASNPEEGLKRLLLENNHLLITRQIEMLNIFVGFEQSNRYIITNEREETLGYVAEEPRGLLSLFSRQLFRTHRPFRAVVMDAAGSPILWLRRPFAWINSRMFVQRLEDYHTYTPEGEPVLDTFAEVQQRWHLWRRRYDLFLKQETRRILSLASETQPEPEPVSDVFNQFTKIDAGFWAWHFTLNDARGEEVASVNRTFRGFGREIFTDTGRYSVNFVPQPPNPEDPSSIKPSVIRDLTLEERALVLAMAVNIDFDYFSRHSEGHGMGFPFIWGSWGSGD